MVNALLNVRASEDQNSLNTAEIAANPKVSATYPLEKAGDLTGARHGDDRHGEVGQRVGFDEGAADLVGAHQVADALVEQAEAEHAAAGGVVAVILANIVAFFLMRGIGKHLDT